MKQVQRYLEQLLDDIEGIIINRWKECIPHYYEAGIPDPYLIPPTKELSHTREELEQQQSARDINEMFTEVERYLSEEPIHSMYQQFGLKAVSFPTVDFMNEEQTAALNNAILRLWAAHNISACLPNVVPAKEVYPILLERMKRPVMIMRHGHTGIEFCNYEPEHCPWSQEFCTCKDF